MLSTDCRLPSDDRIKESGELAESQLGDAAGDGPSFSSQPLLYAVQHPQRGGGKQVNVHRNHKAC